MPFRTFLAVVAAAAALAMAVGVAPPDRAASAGATPMLEPGRG